MAIIQGTTRQGEFLVSDRFNRQIIPVLGASGRIDGTVPLNAAATIRLGEFVMKNTAGEAIISDGSTVYGMALYDVSTAPLGSEVDRPLVFATSGGTAQLTRSNGASAVNVANVAIRATTTIAGGTLYTGGGTDYSFVASTGVVTHIGGGTIVVGATNFASFDYSLTVAEAATETNYIGSSDYVTIMQSGLIPLAVGSFVVSTPRYAKNRTYTLSGTGSILYVNSSGILTNDSTSAVRVGRVEELPTTESPRLRARLDISGAL